MAMPGPGQQVQPLARARNQRESNEQKPAK
jgi:hypothetical protein